MLIGPRRTPSSRRGRNPGVPLAELLQSDARDILGASALNVAGRFPLLVKFIDASANLSIQVHPDVEGAERIGDGAEAKSEAWYILGAEPGSAVYAGVEPGVTPEEFAARATQPGAESMLTRWEVQAGDCITVPGGTVHAIGAGVTLLEVQQNSDTSFRLNDWGRVGLDGQARATHVEEALSVMIFGERSRPPVRAGQAGLDGERRLHSRTARLSQTDYFAIDVHEVRGSAQLSTADRFAIYVAVSGTGRIELPGTSEVWPLGRGDTWLLPASIGEHLVVPDGDAMTLLKFSTS